MNKEQLKKELKEKIRKGIKPSDLKKQREENISLTKNERSLSDFSKSDEGYVSDEEPETKQPSQTKTLEQALQEAKQKISQLQEQAKQWKEILHKSNLLITEKEQTIKKLQEQNNSLTKTKITEVNKEIFNCYHCQKEQLTSLLVLELPEGKLCQSCWQLLRKKTKEQTKVNPSICHYCQQPKPVQIIKVAQTDLEYNLIQGQSYPFCSNCLPLIKEHNEKELDGERELDIWE